MDVTAITQLISNLGFPIACCIALFWRMNKQDENHKEEMNGMKTAIDNNTLVITKLYERMGGEDGK